MDYRDKINVYVPREIGTKLRNDARLFEVFKRNKRELNLNHFLSLILCGYYDQYCSEIKDKHDDIVRIIRSSSYIPEAQQEILAGQIVDQVFLPTIPSRKGKKPVCLSLKPTKETDRIIQAIKFDIIDGDYLSQYICRLLISYCNKPISERERIVFKEKYDILKMACSAGQSVTFSLIWNEDHVYELIPYAVATGTEEMFNYLVGEGKHHETGEPIACTFRLNRITQLSLGRTNRTLTPSVQRHCQRMVEIAPQYPINADEEICVRLSDAGEKLYNRIYYGRPAYDRIIDQEDGHYYYFTCSGLQILHYFRRFDNATAIILSPPELRTRIISFHANSLSAYTETLEEC